MRSFSKISEPAREQELKKFKFLTSKKIAQQSTHKILFSQLFYCFLPISNDPTSTKSTDDEEFSVTSHDCHEAIVAETERYKRQRADFFCPSMVIHHHRDIIEHEQMKIYQNPRLPWVMILTPVVASKRVL